MFVISILVRPCSMHGPIRGFLAYEKCTTTPQLSCHPEHDFTFQWWSVCIEQEGGRSGIEFWNMASRMTKVDVSQCPDYKTRLCVSSNFYICFPLSPMSLARLHFPLSLTFLWPRVPWRLFLFACVCVHGVCRKKLVDSKEELAKLTGCWPLELHYCTSNWGIFMKYLQHIASDSFRLVSFMSYVTAPAVCNHNGMAKLTGHKRGFRGWIALKGQQVMWFRTTANALSYCLLNHSMSRIWFSVNSYPLFSNNILTMHIPTPHTQAYMYKKDWFFLFFWGTTVQHNKCAVYVRLVSGLDFFFRWPLV